MTKKTHSHSEQSNAANRKQARGASLDPRVKEWLDSVIIPILLAELAKRDVELAA
ncbi:MAG TPA: hypothetical protein VIX37_07650 [Candidatus Sulfotelmatobacter sp.]